MAAPADLHPSASGTLAKNPLAHLLVFVAEKRLDGTLLLRDRKGAESFVAFVQGAPGKVKTSFATAPFGRVLTQLGLLDYETVESAAQAATAAKEPIGEYLLSLGKIDHAQLVAALREQIMRRMIRLFEQVADDTAYEFYANVNLLDGWGGPLLTPIDPYRVLWEGINARPNDPRIEPTLTRLGSAPVRLNPSAQLDRFGFGPPELLLIDLLRAMPLSIDDLVDRAVLPVRQSKLLAYALLITKSIVVAPEPASTAPEAAPRARQKSSPGEDGAAAGVPTRSTSPTMPGRAVALSEAEEAALRDEIKRRAANIDTETYFVALGVTEEAGPDVIRSAYFALAKKWHPDRLPSSLADVRDDAARVFGRISEAHATLTDAERRQKYVTMLKSGGAEADEQAKVQRVIDATLDFQKAEVFAKKRDFEKAEKLVQRAIEGDPEQPDYMVLLAWVLANRPERMASKDFLESLSLLNKAIALEPRCERARFYRATLLKMLGKQQAAVADFREAANLNPRNIDAVREVRLWEMRGPGQRDAPQDATPAPAAPARGTDRPIDWTHDGVGEIFGKLFKKK